MKRASFVLACLALCFGIYFLVGDPSTIEMSQKKQAITFSGDIQRVPPVEVFQASRPLSLPEKPVMTYEEPPVEPVSIGEYIDPMDSSSFSGYGESIEIGEYIDPMDLSYGEANDAVSIGEYIPVDAQSGYKSGGDAVSIGEYIPLDAASGYGSDRDAVSIGEYLPVE
jgi:hypothetical protein